MSKIGFRPIGALLACILLCASPGVAPAFAAGFLDSVDDMPLMAGLTETGEGGIAFDKPDGRIVRAVATGPVSADAVERFYIDTLPQLGWSFAPDGETGRLAFEREQERLEIHLTPGAAGAVTEVRFSIEPK